MLKKFNDIFQIKPEKDQGKIEFVNRMSTLLDSLTSVYYEGYSNILKGICFELGLNPREFEIDRFIGGPQLLTLPSIAKGDFRETLKITSALYSHFRKNNNHYWRSWQRMDEEIPGIIKLSTTNIGVRWSEGFFYPDNIPEIDHLVIDQTLSWLSDFPAAKRDLQTALTNFTNSKTDQVLQYCYNALENIIQEKTEVKKPLHEDALRKALLQKLEVSDNWRQFLVKFVEYANDYGRHGKNPQRHSVDPAEVESYLYLSFIIIRMIIDKLPSKKRGFLQF